MGENDFVGVTLLGLELGDLVGAAVFGLKLGAVVGEVVGRDVDM